MNRRIFPFLFAAAALIAAITAGGLLFARPAAAPESPAPAASYRLREYQGKLGVFRAGEAQPQQVIDLDIRLLPPYDQGKLRTGIPAEGEAELARLIEDYTS